jgi:DNA-binding transcriptional ArsR family regulator
VPDHDAARIARLGAVLSSESRASILAALMAGTRHTHTELARFLGRSVSSVSEHVGALVDAGLVQVEAQGRHRYVRLADAGVADLLEHISRRDVGSAVPLPRVPAELAFARSCYGHLAGRLGVAMLDGMVTQGWAADTDGSLHLSDAGAAAFHDLGVTPRPGRTPAVRACLDWSQRRPHLAGAYGDALLDTLLQRRWLRRHPSRPRVLELTRIGRSELPAIFHIEVP